MQLAEQASSVCTMLMTTMHRYTWSTKIVSRVSDNCTGCVDVHGHDGVHDEEVRHPLDEGARTQAYPSLYIPTPRSSTRSRYAPRKCIGLHLLETLFLYDIKFVTKRILIEFYIYILFIYTTLLIFFS